MKKNLENVEQTNDLIVQETNVIGNVEYRYATVERSKNHAVVIFEIDEQQKAIKVLSKNHITLLNATIFKRYNTAAMPPLTPA